MLKPRSFLLCIYSLALLLMLTSCYRSLINLETTRIDHMAQDQAYLNQRVPQKKVLQLTLDDAIKLALEKNLDIMVAQQQFAVQQEALYHQRWFMIPQLELDANSIRRNNSTASTDIVVSNPSQPQPYEISVDKRTKTSELTLSWDLLNFGVAYYRSRQAANSALVTFFQYERTKQNIILEVTTQFWKVAALQKGFRDSKDWLKRVDEVVDKLDQYAKDGRLSPVQVASFSSTVLDNKVRIEVFMPDLLQSIATLNNLLGLPPKSILN